MTDPLLSTNALVWPTLQAMKALGGTAHVLEIERAVIERENLSREVQTTPHADHGTKLNYRLRWARTELQSMGAIENLKRGSGMWRVTPFGHTLNHQQFEQLLKGRKPRVDCSQSSSEGGLIDSQLNSSLAAVMRADGVTTFARPDAPIIESVAKSILANCLVNDGSVLGRPVWTLDNLAILHREYVDNPDPSGASFHEKLRGQLTRVPRDARQLFAELYILNILPVSNIKQSTKLAYIEDVLAPLEPAVEVPPTIREAFAHGMFNGGRGFSSRRWAQLSFLIEFAEYYKRHDASTRQEAATEPLVMRRLVQDSPGHREPAQRYALLYLFHPDFFLPMINPIHRAKLRDGFAEEFLVGGKTDDLDADLHEIDNAVIADAGGPVDYYRPPWRYRWLQSNLDDDHDAGGNAPAESDERIDNPYSIGDIVLEGCFHELGRIQQILNRWEAKKNLILQGAPGTGKTWLARRLAYALIGSRVQHEVRSVQFHPSISYEDFVRGWRPTIETDGAGKLVLCDGPLVQHAELARQQPDIPHVLIIEEINRGNTSQIFGEMLTLIEATKRNSSEALTLSYARGINEQFYLPENLYIIGTMNIADRSLAMVDFALRRRFAFETLQPAFTPSWEAFVRRKLPNDEELVLRIREKVISLNEQISLDPTLGPDFVIGHSFFTPAETQTSGTDWVTGVIESEIAPLLREYWFDNRELADQTIAELKS